MTNKEATSKVSNEIDYERIDADRKRGIKFSDDGTVLIKYPEYLFDETYQIPNGVTKIGEGAFYGTFRIGSMVIPVSAFRHLYRKSWGCDSLYSIIVPDSVTEIGAEAFKGCGNLNSIVIPDGVIKIELANFYLPPMVYLDFYRHFTLKNHQFLPR